LLGYCILCDAPAAVIGLYIPGEDRGEGVS